MNKVDTNQVLDLIIEECDAGDGITIRKYLIKLLSMVWREEESFNGKRPFGNSGWQRDIAKPLVKAKVIKGQFDDDGFLDSFDNFEMNKVVICAIESMGDK